MSMVAGALSGPTGGSATALAGFGWTAPTGGVPPYAANFEVSAHGAGSWATVAGSPTTAAASGVASAGRAAATAYDYRVVWTDSTPTTPLTATSATVATETATGAAPSAISGLPQYAQALADGLEFASAAVDFPPDVAGVAVGTSSAGRAGFCFLGSVTNDGGSYAASRAYRMVEVEVPVAGGRYECFYVDATGLLVARVKQVAACSARSGTTVLVARLSRLPGGRAGMYFEPCLRPVYRLGDGG